MLARCKLGREGAGRAPVLRQPEAVHCHNSRISRRGIAAQSRRGRLRHGIFSCTAGSRTAEHRGVCDAANETTMH
eukprot:scaffold252337_cov30-Tisochrysis_lutea.AAC.2